jgi:hypothetical protein
VTLRTVPLYLVGRKPGDYIYLGYMNLQREESVDDFYLFADRFMSE